MKILQHIQYYLNKKKILFFITINLNLEKERLEDLGKFIT